MTSGGEGVSPRENRKEEAEARAFSYKSEQKNWVVIGGDYKVKKGILFLREVPQ